MSTQRYSVTPHSIGTLLAWVRSGEIAMSKIAVNETYGGNLLRKAIDYFCHLAIAPKFLGRIEKHDLAFAQSEFHLKHTVGNARKGRPLPCALGEMSWRQLSSRRKGLRAR